jgi:hypothetical protein
MRRLSIFVAAVTAVAVPATMLAISVPGSAGAVTPTTISCSKLSGNINGNIKITGAKCKAKPPHGYGNITFTALQLAGGGQLFWANGDNFTVTAPITTTPNPPRGACKKGYDEEDSTGTVTASSPDAYDAQLVGTTYSSRTCVNTPGKITLVKKTKFTL